jgi:hypothetical protein
MPKTLQPSPPQTNADLQQVDPNNSQANSSRASSGGLPKNRTGMNWNEGQSSGDGPG